jgi:hydrogenase maturation protease
MNLDGLIKILSNYNSGKIIFIGLGNRIRGDDWAGILFLRKLKTSEHFIDSLFIEAGICPENYITSILEFNPRVIVFIDAAYCSCIPGEINIIDPAVIDQSGISTHTYSVRLIEKYIRCQGNVKFFYLGITPLHTNTGRGISSTVVEGINNFFKIV